VPRPIRLVVACADTKSLEVNPARRYAEFQNRRLSSWIKTLEDTPPVISARRVYAGVYWTAVKGAADELAGIQGSQALSVMSAGYGLISAEAPIHPYAATFSPGSDDSIPQERQAKWWSGLCEWPGPVPGSARSITSLVTSEEAPALIIVGSPAYLKAVSLDLAAATHAAHLRNQPFVIVSTGARNSRGSFREFEWALMQTDARLEQVLGVGKVALNARIAGYLTKVAEYDGDRLEQARARIEQQCMDLQKQVVIKRSVMTDERVLAFIRKHLRSEPDAPFTRLLRALRNSGLACEYKRFRALYDYQREEVR
jgi:hypothetical protein